MTDKEVYRIWAPERKTWVDWVRPVPFIKMSDDVKQYAFSEIEIPVSQFAASEYLYTAIIVDLPGVESVKEGIALAKAGYRPIPVYNGTIEQQGARATVDNQSVGSGLRRGAALLQEIEIKEDAPPAFLLDSNRMNRYKMEVSLFDNSWDIYPQDLPSAEYLQKSGIQRVMIISDVVSKDLKKILYEYQKKGIGIVHTERYGTPKKIRIYKQFYKN